MRQPLPAGIQHTAHVLKDFGQLTPLLLAVVLGRQHLTGSIPFPLLLMGRHSSIDSHSCSGILALSWLPSPVERACFLSPVPKRTRSTSCIKIRLCPPTILRQRIFPLVSNLLRSCSRLPTPRPSPRPSRESHKSQYSPTCVIRWSCADMPADPSPHSMSEFISTHSSS